MSTASLLSGTRPAESWLDDDEHLFEELDGNRVELPPMSRYATLIAGRLQGSLAPFAKAHQLGESVMEMLFQFPPPVNRRRRPDVAFVSYARWPKNRSSTKTESAWEVVPDLAVEVVSPSDFADDVLLRVIEFFAIGVGLVWVVYPLHSMVCVYRSLANCSLLRIQEVLDGGDVLPGFRLPLAELFDADEPAAPASAGP